MNGPKILTSFHSIISRARHIPRSIDCIYIDSSREDKRMAAFIKYMQKMNCTIHFVSANRIDNLIKGKHQGVVAFCSKIQFMEKSIDEVLDKIVNCPPLLLILDGVKDPHNLGACLRSAEAAGAHAVIIPKDRSASYSNPIVNRVSCGAIESIPCLIVTNLARALRQLKDRGIQLIGTNEYASSNLYKIDANQPIAWIMGSENEGMRRLTRDACDQLVSIPMLGEIKNLNVSVASAICLYESMRQRYNNQ